MMMLIGWFGDGVLVDCKVFSAVKNFFYFFGKKIGKKIKKFKKFNREQRNFPALLFAPLTIHIIFHLFWCVKIISKKNKEFTFTCFCAKASKNMKSE